MNKEEDLIEKLVVSSTESKKEVKHGSLSEEDQTKVNGNLLLNQVKLAKFNESSSKRKIYLSEENFNPEDGTIKDEMMRLIVQYLQDEGYWHTCLTIQEESTLKYNEAVENQKLVKKLKKSILDGDWNEAEKLCQKPSIKKHKKLVFEIYKQMYLEYLEKGETHKALVLLRKKLKPLENQTTVSEFRDLCYLMTSKASPQSILKSWDGSEGNSRENLLFKFQSFFALEDAVLTPALSPISPHRLIDLLQQATAYQVEFGPYRPLSSPKVDTLTQDYHCFVLPNSIKHVFSGHKQNVKCVTFIGRTNFQIASGSNDGTIKIWSAENGNLITTLSNNGRIWDLASNKESLLASASGDSTVKLWRMNEHTSRWESIRTINYPDYGEGDSYVVAFANSQLITGGFDKTMRLFDIETGALKKSFVGHTSSILSASFSEMGNFIITGSKDSTIKLWDVASGICVKTITSHWGEVTNVEINSTGAYLLSTSKDNSNRLWDLRTGVSPVQRFTGHQHASKTFVGSTFGPNDSVIIGGSEDGIIYIWDIKTGKIQLKLRGHKSVVNNVAWSENCGLLASCSQDKTVCTWWYDENLPIGFEDGSIE